MKPAKGLQATAHPLYYPRPLGKKPGGFNTYRNLILILLMGMFLLPGVALMQEINVAEIYVRSQELLTGEQAGGSTAENEVANSNKGAEALLNKEELALLQKVNEEREARGLQPLKLDAEMSKLAAKKARDMLENEYIGHTSPNLGRPGDMARKAGISFASYGENITGSLTAAELPPGVAHEHLMDSPSHRGAILDEKLTHIGIGYANGDDGGAIYVQQFRR